MADTINLVVKAANQKFEDFAIENCQVSWTIKELKDHLSSHYPNSPPPSSIRLIYSGKLLHDHFSLKDCIRHASEVSTHIIHLVHSPSSQKPTIGRSLDDNDAEMDNELTPESSIGSETFTMSPTSSLNSSPDASSSTRQSNLSSATFIMPESPTQTVNQHQNEQNLTEKQRYDFILNNMVNYYQAMGVPVQSNPFYSCYVQQMALYNHMYMNFINSVSPMSIPIQPVPEMSTPTFGAEARQAETPVEPQAEQRPAQQQRAARNQANNNNDGEREDDWLGMLHNFVSFLILLSIVYYYSSLERFLVIFVVAIVLICYHKGWLQLQRRRVNPPQQNQERREQGENQRENERENNDGENDRENVNEETNQLQTPSTLRLVLIFVLKFFTSLIPERPRAVN